MMTNEFWTSTQDEDEDEDERERECLFSWRSISFFNEIIRRRSFQLKRFVYYFFCVAKGLSSAHWRQDKRSDFSLSSVFLLDSMSIYPRRRSSIVRSMFSNPNQRHDSQWANEWRQYKWPTREHIVLNSNLSKNLSPEHGFAHRAEFCSFWLDFLPKMITTTCSFDTFLLDLSSLCLSLSLSANISEEEIRWKHEFRQYQERVQQWDYYYAKYLDLLEKNGEKLIKCLG